MPVFNNILAGAAGQAGGAAAGYEIERSLRFNDDDSAYLSKTFSSQGSCTTYTISLWTKRGKLGISNLFNAAGTASASLPNNERTEFRFNTTDKLHFAVKSHNPSETLGALNSTLDWRSLETGAVFRDPSAWYHIVVSVDTTQTTASDRVTIWVNGIEQAVTGSYPTLNEVTPYGRAHYHTIGAYANGTNDFHDGYLADVHFIDGQALTETDFGKYDTNNVWQPKAYSGTYGTNGFHLDFSDNSSNDAIGTDSSGNNNDWTPNNINGYIGDGTIYSTSLSTNTTIVYPASRAFNGDLTNQPYGSHNSGGYWLLSGVSIPYTTSLEVYKSLNISATVELNGVSVGNPTYNAWTTIATGSGTLTSLKVSRGGDSFFFAAIRIDGTTILLDDNVVDRDSLIDSPTNYEADSGNNGGNYATLNPITGLSNAGTPSNGNLDWSDGNNLSTIQIPSSGKWYAEQTITGLGSDVTWGASFGVRSYDISRYARLRTAANKGEQSNLGTASTPFYSQLSVGDVISIAVDSDIGSITFYVNSSYVYTVSSISDMSGLFFYTAFASSGDAGSWNFGQRPFQQMPLGVSVSGYKALCTQNFDDPTIEKPSDHFDIALDTGTNILSSTKALCDNGADFLWIKDRDNAGTNHHLIDIIRDTQLDGTPFLSSNSNGSESTLGTYSAPSGSSVGWAWDAGDSNSQIAVNSLATATYNQSQTWSTSKTGSFASNLEANAFNGELSTSSSTGRVRPSNGTTAGFTFTSFGANTVTSLKIWVHRGGSGGTVFTINGTDVTSTVDAATNSSFVDFGSTFSEFTAITFNADSNGSDWYSIAGIEVNGQLLVDSNITIPNLPSLASTVRANTNAGFSIVSYSGNSTGTPHTIAHGLNAKPGLIFVKKRNEATVNWAVYNEVNGAGEFMRLNTTAESTAGSGYWNDTEPTSSVFTVGGINAVNNTGGDYIAYCWTAVEGYSAIGSYTGNGNQDTPINGPFVYTGFRPRWILIKRTNGTNDANDWVILDAKRDGYNVDNNRLYANESTEENTGDYIDILSNGFKIRRTGLDINNVNSTYLYLAIAENPFKHSRAR